MATRLLALAILLGVLTASDRAHASVLATGEAHILLVKSDGTVLAWGQNYYGQLGDGTTDASKEPRSVSGLTDINAVAAGARHSLALAADGTVWAWGHNANGQLGDGTTADHSLPEQVPGLTSVIAIAAGRSHSLAITATGAVWTWGSNSSGQLGNGTTTPGLTPMAVAGLTNITAVAGGDYHTVARRIDGTVYAWGANNAGQLGDNSFTQRLSPVSAASLSDVVAVTAGSFFSAAIKADGTLWTWGSSSEGQLGDGTTTNRNLAAQVPGIGDVVAVAAGFEHIVALSSTQGLFAWGWNLTGQLGDGTTTSRSSPVNLPGVPAPDTLAASGLFSVGVTADGRLITWGDNADGQLGDGTTLQSLTPIEVTDPGLVWKVSRPIFAPEAGTYAPDLSVWLYSDTVGASIYYTTDGSVPSEASLLVPTSGELRVEQSQTVRARAFKVGMPASLVSTASYDLQVGAPTFSPASATFNAPRTVKLLTSTSGATIRFTVDGTEPSESSTAYTGPILIDSSTVVKAKAFRAGALSSDVASATYECLLTTPQATPKPGTFSTPPTVTLAWDASATLRYTVNGTEPTPSSPLYTAPLALSGPATVMAKAFKTGWESSATLVATYDIGTDSAAPTITARHHPAANTAGWNATPVKIAFACEDDFAEPLDCTAPITVSTEGANQTVNGTAEDLAGHTATLSVTANVDFTAPTVTLTAPVDGASTSSATVTVTATVTDSLSGISSVRCAGVSVTVGTGGVVTCDAALAKGRNTILVEAIDVAGHGTAVPVHVTRTGSGTSLQITPTQLSLLVDQVQTLQALDDFGHAPTGVTWSSSDVAVADMSATEAGTVIAVGAGTATITAAVGGMTTTMDVTVVSGSTMTTGSVLWSVPGGGAEWAQRAYAHRVDIDGPDLYVLEQSGGGPPVLLGLRVDGRVVSRQGLAFIGPDDEVRSMVGDAFGGVLMNIRHLCSTYLERGCASVVRTGHGSAGTWQYRTSAEEIGGLVQNSAGDVFGYEVTSSGQTWSGDIGTSRATADVIRVNGATGAVVSRTSLPQSYMERPNCDHGTIYVDDVAAAAGGLVVGADDDVYALVRQRDERQLSPGCSWENESYAISESLQLMRVSSSTGGASFSTLETDSASFSGHGHQGTTPPAWPSEVSPDSRGGLLAWGSSQYYVSEPTHAMYVTNGSHQELSYVSSWSRPPLIGNDGTAYIQDVSDRLIAVDPTTGSTRWTLPTPGTAVAALSDGGAAVFFDDGSVPTISLVNSSGGVTGTYPVPLQNASYWTDGAWHGDSGAFGFASIAGPRIWEDSYYVGTRGNLQGQKAGKKPAVVSFRPVDELALSPFSWTSEQADASFRVDVTALLAVSRAYLVEAASLHTFYEELKEPRQPYGTGVPIDAVAFVGHAVYQSDATPYYSVGLQFFDYDLIKLRHPLGDQWTGNRGPAFARRVYSLQTQVKVVFIGSCYVGDAFKSLWNITDSSQNQVLIVPNEQGLTDLIQASRAWQRVATELVNGKTVAQAVQAWNASVTPPFRYTYVGDGNVKIAGPRTQ